MFQQRGDATFLKACGDFGAIYRAQNKINRTARRKIGIFPAKKFVSQIRRKDQGDYTTLNQKRSPSINRIMLSLL